jgi:hypothetical protein
LELEGSLWFYVSALVWFANVSFRQVTRPSVVVRVPVEPFCDGTLRLGFISRPMKQSVANSKGWGGARVGSGKKPRPAPFDILPGGRSSGPTRPEDPHDLTEPPRDLPADQHAFWREHAPLAIERKTLTPATVPAFRLLCELHAKKVVVGAMVDKGALGGLKIFMQLSKQIETLLARFSLAPFGKPATSEKPKKAINPFAQVAG